MDIYKQEFGRRLREARKRINGLSQEKLGERVGVSEASVSRWENGHDFPEDWRLPYICSALEIDQSHFLVGSSALRDVAETAAFLAKFDSIPRILQDTIIAIVYKRRETIQGFPPDIAKPALELLDQAWKIPGVQK